MKYSTPELVVLGTAASLVLGIDGGTGDHVNPTEEKLPAGLAIGLDD